MNTTDFLSIGAAICPGRPLVIFDDRKWTYEQTSARVSKLAAALKGLGLHKGDRLGMLEVNCSQYLEAYFAAARLGVIFVPLNFRAKENELSYMIGNAGIKVLLVGERYLEMARRIQDQSPAVEHCVSLGAGSDGLLSYENLLSASSPEDVEDEVLDNDITILMYTSGTTGRPKGVPLRHEGFVSYVLENVEPANPDVEERNLLTVPLYHVAGIQAMLAAVYGGRTIVLMRQFETVEWMQTVEREKITRAMLVPTMLKWVIDHPDFNNYDLSSLKVITYGAAPMPIEVIKKAIGQMPGARFINAFGQTETASTIAFLGPDDHVLEGTSEEVEKKLKRLASSVGKPLPDVEVKIVDEQGRPCPVNAVGEILARGPRVMKGYWEEEEKTKKVITGDGWLRMGDQGWMDEEGYLYLSGRSDDIIIRAGENISPEEIEDVLRSHPKVEDAAVIGSPDPEWGQEPRALVVLKKGLSAGPEEIMEHCRSNLASFKRPRSVVFLEDLPRNPMGKVLKKELQAKYGQADGQGR